MGRTLVHEIINNLFLLRIIDNQVRYFEALWEIPEGITYNAYLLRTSEGSILFDGWKGEYTNDFIDTIKRVMDLNEIRYVVVHHMEPDHTGSLKRVLELIEPKPLVIGRPMVKDMIRSFYGTDVKFKPIKKVEEMKIGEYNLMFIPAPWLHWPETMITYVKELKTLLTCDAFGGYGVPHKIFDDEELDISQYLRGVKKYLATVIGSYKSHIVKNIDNLLSLNIEIKMLAPGHGLLWRKDPKRIIDYYYHLAKGEVKERKALVVYDSMYGFVEKAISKVIKILKDYMFNVEIFRFNDKERAKMGEIISEASDSSFIVLGISTYENDMFPLMKNVINMLIKKVTREVSILIISSYGWGPVVGTKALEAIKNSKFKIVDVIQFRGTVSEDFEAKVRSIISKIIAS